MVDRSTQLGSNADPSGWVTLLSELHDLLYQEPGPDPTTFAIDALDRLTLALGAVRTRLELDAGPDGPGIQAGSRVTEPDGQSNSAPGWFSARIEENPGPVTLAFQEPSTRPCRPPDRIWAETLAVLETPFTTPSGTSGKLLVIGVDPDSAGDGGSAWLALAARMIAAAMLDATRQRAIAAEERRLGRLLEESPFAVLEWDERGAIRRWNRTAAAMFGMESESVLGRPVLDLLFPPAERSRVARTWNFLPETGVNRSTHRNLTGRGDSIVCDWSFFERLPGAGANAGMAAVVADITDRIEAELQLSHIHTHDELTDLPNRNLLTERMRQCIARRRRDPGFKFAVLFLDLDRFKFINDSLGHRVGDELLRVVARRLQSQLRAVDTVTRTENATTVARLGGDEFTILLEGLREEIDATRVAERILAMLRSPFQIDGHEVHCGGSIGIAMSSMNYDSPEDILRDADIAMYRAKATAPGKYVVFDSEMHGRFLALVQLENDLRRAVTREEWFLVYQPIVELETGKLRGFESLIRWRHPTAGVIPPIKFIPVAEDTGLIIPMGDWTLRSACGRMRSWIDRFPEAAEMSVSVNLSSKQFRQPQLVERIREILADANLPAPNLRLEITESDVMDDIRRTAGMLKELRDVGVKLAIDDFGTGHSSLSYLHRLPADTLKVDRSFVMAMNEERENREIVKTIVDLAHHLRMNVTAEGVETAAHLASLQQLGCEQGQGYYFSKPLEAERAEAGLSAGNLWQPDGLR